MPDLMDKTAADRARKFFIKQRTIMSLMDIALENLEDLGSPSSKYNEEATFDGIDWRNFNEVIDFFSDLGLELKFSVMRASNSQ